MLMEIMLLLSNPDQFVATLRNGEIYVEPEMMDEAQDLDRRGTRRSRAEHRN